MKASKMFTTQHRAIYAAALAFLLGCSLMAQPIGRMAFAQDCAGNCGGGQQGQQGGKGISVGEALPPGKIHVITRPGLYGMGEPPRGSRYGIVNGRLIRFDPGTSRVLSVIRQVDRILD
ncbi:hypothetical protein IQ24_00787 [Paracoccus sulfuroxidans]|uniref:Nickel/cobalt transporter regulator n=2 Tax=Paracoccus sulfuroxidans TaxID=384678 RepID=A0A562NXN7_9RHOB|nr:hypothetical protein IQ24_00787 [Paracoccus sulfuroxidans]